MSDGRNKSVQLSKHLAGLLCWIKGSITYCSPWFANNIWNAQFEFNLFSRKDNILKENVIFITKIENFDQSMLIPIFCFLKLPCKWLLLWISWCSSFWLRCKVIEAVKFWLPNQNIKTRCVHVFSNLCCLCSINLWDNWYRRD